jgi:glutathione S-transferase
LWESGAIIEYLIEKYDTEHLISFPAGTNESFHTKQWLYYQASGQGPYFGQASWFIKFHSERITSAVERYVAEVNRVTGVLEGHLAKQQDTFGGGNGGPWLVGDKYSYADLSFVAWQTILPLVVKEEDGYTIEKFPVVKGWLRRISQRDGVKAVLADLQPVL